MEIKTGIVISVDKLNSNLSEIQIDDGNNEIYTFTIENLEINRIKLGECVVVYKNELENNFNIKLMSDLI